MRFPPKIFLMMLALIVTLTAHRSVELKVRGVGDVRVRDEVLLEQTHKGARKDGAISAPSQEMNIEQRKEKDSSENEVEARFMPAEIAITELDAAAWTSARPVTIGRYWSGEDAPLGRHAEARLLWSNKALYVRFVYRQTEPKVTSPRPQTKRKTIGLWERDVCEIFIAPDAREPERYFEFEAAPTGEWLDLRIHYRPEERETDWEFHSGMTAAARVQSEQVTIAMRVPWKALGRRPAANERWRGNLFRVCGSGDTRGYVAWRPTHTPEPNFHLPSAFGWIKFGKQESEFRIRKSE